MAKLILASGSAARRKMLTSAGVNFLVSPSTVDEPALRVTMQGLQPEIIALELAKAKAEQVSVRHPEALVIGADQLLVCEGEIYAKASSLEEAKNQLSLLSGKTHALPTAVVLAEGGKTIWSCVETPSLTMRNFSGEFLAWYVSSHRDKICDTVGGYEIEGLGAQLFDRIGGDYFSILGLPLFPLLGKLRELGVLAA